VKGEAHRRRSPPVISEIRVPPWKAEDAALEVREEHGPAAAFHLWRGGGAGAGAPGGPGDGFEVAARAREMGVRIFALQQARDLGTPDGFSATRPGWDDQVRSLARDIETLDFERFIFRADS